MTQTQSTQAAPAAAPAESIVTFAAAIAVLAVDLGIKFWVEANMALYQSIFPLPFLEPYLGFTHARNTGVAFSMFQGAGNLVVIFGTVVSAALIYQALRMPGGNRVVRLALGLILGGTLGNLIDRLRQGYVTDMIHFRVPQIGFDFPVSNFADVFIFCGVVLLVGITFWRDRQVTQTAVAEGNAF
jgi:signal peptidase II